MDMYVESYFSIDDEIKVRGYHDISQDWNGFSCPLFEEKDIMEWLKATQELEKAIGYDEVITFEKLDFDDVIVVCPAGSDWPEHYPVMEVEGKKLYSVGAFCWCWMEVPSNEEAPEI